MAAGRRKQQWKAADIFAVPLPDGKYCLGQALGIMGDFKNVVNCALFDVRVQALDGAPPLDREQLIAVVSTTRDLLDNGHWRIIGKAPMFIAKSSWPNEEFAKKGYVGAVTYGSGIVNNFLAAYYGLFAWNGYKDPAYFDKLLVSPAKKPPNSALKFKDS
jgi:hypothetical protein